MENLFNYFLHFYKPYLDLKVTISLRSSACKVITVQPCFDIDTVNRRLKEKISIESLHFSDTLTYTLDPIANKYLAYHHGKKCQRYRINIVCSPRYYLDTIYIVDQINLQRTSCLALQVLPEKFTKKIVSNNLSILDKRIKGRRIRTVCHHYFIITGPSNLNFRGYYMKNFTPKDKSRTDILSNSEESSEHKTKSGMTNSFHLTGKLAMINIVMDLQYFQSPTALVVQSTEKVASANFKFQMARIKEHHHEIMVLFWSILRINIPKRTNVINQCKNIDIKVIPPSHANNTKSTCTDAFVSLHFYGGHHEVISAREQKYSRFRKHFRKFCTFVDFACLQYHDYTMTVWYRINCSESQLLSFVVDSKVSYSVGNQNLVFPRNIDFEIVHKINNKNLYRESSGFIGVTISDTTECFNPTINFAEYGKMYTILNGGNKYSLFESDDVLNHTGIYYSIVDVKENLTWNMVAEFCESRGMHLPTIGDAEEERAVLSLLSQKSPERSDMSVSVYLGLTSQRQVYIFHFCPNVLSNRQ